MRSLLGSVLLPAITVALSGCASQRSNRPLLTVPPAAAVDNDIYVADQRGVIRALRPDGSEQWNLSLAEEIAKRGFSASHDLRIDMLAALSGGKLFGLATQLSGSNTGGTILFALDANRLMWEVGAPYPEQNGSPIAIGADAVYEASHDGALYAFARADGQLMWKYQVSGGPLGTPTIAADGTIYVTGANYNLHAIGPDGRQRWVVGTQK